ncbi:hypothetical protein [Actinoplanes awajinensis]|nr:hypothetical protein [Actinoplanes awajinensis]
MGKPLTCRLGRHRWVRRATEDGGTYKQCVRCGKDHDGLRPQPGSGFSM